MESYKAVRLRIYPNKHQEELLAKNCGCVRFVYNQLLALKIKHYEKTKESLSRNALQAMLPKMKQEFSFLAEVDAKSLQVAVQHLDQAFSNFFRNLKKGGALGFPRFKKKGRSRDSFCIPQYGQLVGNKLKVGKHGWLNVRGGLELLVDKKIKSITVSRTADQWYASCLIEVPEPEVHVHRHVICGIDLGVKRPLTVAYTNVEGEEKSYWFGKRFKENLTRKEVRRKRYQKQLARKQKGSKNREKAKLKVQRAYMHEANCRKEFVEQVSHVLARHFRTIVFEDLKIRNMTKSAKGTTENPGTNVRAKSGLNREMLRLGLSSIVARTEQKALELDGHSIHVNPAYTSQICNQCGSVNKENRKSQAKFKCVECGHTDNADRNAARNIRDLGIASLAV